MKRDMDLIRAILQRIESGEGVTPEQPIEIDGHTELEISYHVALLKDADFIEATIQGDNFEAVAFVHVDRLTWQGHEFLDLSRDDTIWRKARQHFLKPAASWTFSLLLEWLKQEARSKLFGVPPNSSGST